MIKIETKNETVEEFDISIRMEGTWLVLLPQVASVLNRLYEAEPKLFEMALLASRYTKDHT